MKTSKLIGAVSLLLALTLVTFNVTSAKTNNKIGTSKAHHHKKPVVQYYLVFTAGSTKYEVYGTGGQFAGNIHSVYASCGGGSGAATGTYSYNTTTLVMSVTVTSPVVYSGPVSAFDSSPITLTCP